jgi:hypothetical protein
MAGPGRLLVPTAAAPLFLAACTIDGGDSAGAGSGVGGRGDGGSEFASR